MTLDFDTFWEGRGLMRNVPPVHNVNLWARDIAEAAFAAGRKAGLLEAAEIADGVDDIDWYRTQLEFSEAVISAIRAKAEQLTPRPVKAIGAEPHDLGR